ncbi:MAG TPA: PASTA domain-containing protein [Fimbriimonadaceae bacterium]|nr:PASTA domain-containing protein [Fimbriimonadaceae bacterium]
MIGEVFGSRYELVSITTDGPIFTSFQGKEATTGKDVCVRTFRSPFDRELDFVEAVGIAAKKSSSVDHPGVERILGLEHDAGRPFLIGQFSPGITLAERIRKLAPFSVPVAVGTAISILEGLDALHSAGIVHGDVSAENIVIGVDGSARVQLAAVWEAYSRSATAGAVVLPSMAPFLAPEVSAGATPSTGSDVYSVGVLLFELLCGRPPYSADSALAMAMKHATTPTPSVKGFNASAPIVLDEIVKKAMNKDPAARYRTASAMMADLRILQDALRFGRTLSWPLKPAEALEAEPVAVAPRMAAARPPQEREGRRRRRDREDDDPLVRYLGYFAAMFVCILAGVLIMWVGMNASKPKYVRVPTLKGTDIAQARVTLRGLHLELHEGLRQQSEQFPENTVLTSDPEAGDRVREGSTITVVVSSGSGSVEVPDLVGMELDNARSALHNLSLNVSEPVDYIDSKAPRDQVVEQDPPAKRKVGRETNIHLKVSNGTAPPDAAGTAPDRTQAPPADADVTNEYTLHIKLTDAKSTVQVRVEIEDANGTRNIYEESHEPDEEFDVDATGYGPTATFRIYYNDQLKKTIHQSAPGARPRGAKQ